MDATADFLNDLFEFGCAVDADQFLLQVFSWLDDSTVPVGNLAKIEAANVFAAEAHQQIVVAMHEPKPFAERGNARLGSRSLELVELVEDPGIEDAPLPMAIAVQPVSSNMSLASAALRMSPLPITGIDMTASTTRGCRRDSRSL